MLSSKDFPNELDQRDPMGMTASDMKFMDNRDDFLETGSQGSVKTNNDVVLLWDMLKVSSHFDNYVTQI